MPVAVSSVDKAVRAAIIHRSPLFSFMMGCIGCFSSSAIFIGIATLFLAKLVSSHEVMMRVSLLARIRAMAG